MSSGFDRGTSEKWVIDMKTVRGSEMSMKMRSEKKKNDKKCVQFVIFASKRIEGSLWFVRVMGESDERKKGGRRGRGEEEDREKKNMRIEINCSPGDSESKMNA